MSDYDYLAASNGSGDAALMHVSTNRSVGSSTIAVDSIANVPAKFIATSGTILSTGLLDPATITNFKGHTSGSSLQIDSYEPGSSDIGHTAGQGVIIKPTTGWANRVAAAIQSLTGFGSAAPATVTTLAATAINATGVVAGASFMPLTGVFLDGVTNATYRHMPSNADFTAEFFDFSFAHGLSYVPDVKGVMLGGTGTTKYLLPLVQGGSSSGSYNSYTELIVSILSVDSASINLRVSIGSTFGLSLMLSLVTGPNPLRFQFRCTPSGTI